MNLQHTNDNPGIAAHHMAIAFAKAFDTGNPAGGTKMASGGVMLITGEAHPLGNFAIGLADDEVPAASAALAETGLPACLLFTDGVSEEARAHATQAGFSHEAALPAMAVDLATLPGTDLAAGYSIVRLVPGDDPAPWARTLAEGYGLPQPVADAFSPKTIPIEGSSDADMQFFAALYGGAPVAVSMLIGAQGVAGIYCVATLPEHRQRGLGAALTAEPLRRAAAQGYRVGVLQASEMGYSVYRKLGFVDTGSVVMLLRMP
ncbi:MAG: GNAT family N-acetyltransferase [Fimbriimonadaceae bacterium]|nr:GNAT family N-acetyltransferase [Fimbriimonadaceae bacterium]